VNPPGSWFRLCGQTRGEHRIRKKSGAKLAYPGFAFHCAGCPNIETDYLLRAIRSAAAGESVEAEAITGKLVAQLQGRVQPAESESAIDKRTAREKDILACLACGESNKVIARKLDLDESTVNFHVHNVLKKLKRSWRVQAAVFAVAALDQCRG